MRVEKGCQAPRWPAVRRGGQDHRRPPADAGAAVDAARAASARDRAELAPERHGRRKRYRMRAWASARGGVREGNLERRPCLEVLRPVDDYRKAWRRHVAAAGVSAAPEPGPFLIRLQTEAGLTAERFAPLAWDDPRKADGPPRPSGARRGCRSACWSRARSRYRSPKRRPKSSKFADCDRGGMRAAAICTLIGTAKLNDVDPRVWLADVLARIAGTPQNRQRELLPWNLRASRRRNRRE